MTLYTERRFKSPYNEGSVWIYPFIDGRISVNVLGLHGDVGEACINVVCENNKDLFTNVMIIFETLTQDLAEGIGYEYEDIVMGENNEELPLIAENVNRLRMINESYLDGMYISKGMIDTTCKFTYEPLKSNDVIIENGKYIIVY